jgi:glycosyltransferase involved in cell wall biosynthesis
MTHLVLDARTATDHFPGIGRYVTHLSQALARIAPDLGLTLIYDPSAPAARLTLPDLPRIACSASPFSMQQQWIVPRMLRQAGATLFHSPYYLMPYLPGVPSVVTCYDLIPVIYPEYFTAAQRLIYRLAHTLALGTARVVLAISEATRSDLVRIFHLDPRRVAVTPLAAGAHFVPRLPAQIATVRVKYALPEQYALYLGINKPHKNLARLVQAWQISNSKSQIPNLELVIAGQWDERYPEIKQLAKDLGLKDQIVFAGPVSELDLPALYSGATLFIFPSLYEGFGLPVLEAMSCGTPVVCSNTSSLPEVAGDAAILVNPLDTNALAEAMRCVLASQELQQALREKGLAQAAKFSWQRAAQETLAVYRQTAR